MGPSPRRLSSTASPDEVWGEGAGAGADTGAADGDVADDGVAINLTDGGGFRMSFVGPEVPRETPWSTAVCRACLATTVVDDVPARTIPFPRAWV